MSLSRATVLLPYGMLVLAALCWSGNHIVGRAAADDVPPLVLGFARWFIPLVVLTPVAWRHLRQDYPTLRRSFRIFVWFGVSGGAVFGVLQYVGLHHTTALNASILNSLAPVFIVAAGAAAFGDRLSLRQVAGISCSLVGVVLIVTRAQWDVLAAFAFNGGDVIIVANMAILAAYSASLRLRPDVHWLTFIYVISLVSTVVILPALVWDCIDGISYKLSVTGLSAIAYVGVFPSLVAFAAWNAGVAMIGSSRAGPMLHLIPLFSIFLSNAFLGERMAPYHAVGLITIVCGVWLAAHSRRLLPAGRPGT